jgi:nucleoid-associated protein YgaU
MSSLPINFMGRQYAEAELNIVEPAEQKASIKLHYNPKEYKLKKDNTFFEVPIPGLESPPLQYVRGGARTLTMELLVDTSDTLESVREMYVSKVEKLMERNNKLHAPPIVEFVWADQSFRGVLTSLEVLYVLFHSNGTPLRAQLTVAMKEYRTVEIQLKDPLTSPDVEKRYVVRAGETLSSISAAVFRDPAHWREIAVANDITDPRRVAPGTVLTVPRLEAPRA